MQEQREFTQEELEVMQEAGFGHDIDGKTKEERQEFFNNWDTVQLDRGIDTEGTDATYKFVKKVWDEEKKAIERVYCADEINGVVVAIRSQLKSKHDVEPKFVSSEFNPFDKNEIIALFDEDGKKASEDIYQNIKQQKSFQKGEKTESLYNYFINVYIDCGEKKYKLQMKGYDRGQWMRFNNKTKRAELMGHNLVVNVVDAPLGVGGKMVKTIGFMLGDAIEISETLKKMNEIKEYFFKMKKDDQQSDAEENAKETQKQQEEIPVIQVDEEIDIENIELDEEISKAL